MRTHGDRYLVTILDLLERGDDSDIAVVAPDRPALDYRALRLHVEKTTDTFRRLGVDAHDRIAIVLPPGAELATAVIAVASFGAAAPLNPALGYEELIGLLTDLRVSAVLTSASVGGSLHEAAVSLGLPIVHASERSSASGLFDLEMHSEGRTRRRAHPDDEGDTALLLHTSGTTSRPKLVPLRQSQLTSGGENVARVLGLDRGDRCLCVMPLFHIHGIVASLLGSFASGGTVVCAGAFGPGSFLDLLTAMRPTWTTAVPTMLQTVLSRAPEGAPGHTLRLMRTASLALPPLLMRRLEDVFDTPVLEAFGMTEATHQVAANPPPPGERRPGTVGLPAGPDVGVLDDAGSILRSGAGGELVVRGPTVFDGYERNDEANAQSFVDGWFRTGDLASIDADGYITVTGRLKELINRGGEKIGPREVEDALLDHPSVDQAVAFPAPHASLGEEVAAAVVLTPGASVTSHQLRAHVRERLAPFKVPRKVCIVDRIPAGPTGKPQRLALAAQLGLGEVRAR